MTMTRRFLLFIFVAATMAAAKAQGIAEAGADIEILPSSYYNHSAEWTAEVCVFNSGMNYYEGNNSQFYNQVWGSPAKDAGGNEWFALAYSTASSGEDWTTAAAPFCDRSLAATFGRDAFVWADDNVMGDVYLRRSFTTTRGLDGDVFLACCHDDAPAEWYINGVLVKAIADGWNAGEYVRLTDAQKALIKTDGSVNVVAVHTHNNFGGSLADCGLYMKAKGDDDNPSSPSISHLELGYVTPWVGKTMFNPGRNFDGSWPALCSTGEADGFAVSLPQATSDISQARVALCTPIRLLSDHSYRLEMKLTVSTGTLRKARIDLCESDDRSLLSRDVTLRIGRATSIAIDDITGIDCDNLKLVLLLGGNGDGTTVDVAAMSLVDKSAAAENLSPFQLFTFSTFQPFYIQTYYAPNGQRINGPQLTGLQESLDWTMPDFDDSMWDDTTMPVGNSGFIPEVQTIWPGGDNNNYWIRRTFNLDEVLPTSGYTLKLAHDDSYVLYVNGHFIKTAENWTVDKNTEDFDLPASYFNVGKNVIAICQKQNVGGKFFDCGLTITPNAHEAYDSTDPRPLIANELMVGNIDQYLDYSFNYGPWLELYNPTEYAINIGGIYLSDDPDNLKKFMLPLNYGVIKPGGYKTIYFDHNQADGEYGKTADRQVRFNLNEEGGMLYVSDQLGTPFIEMAYPEAISRCSYARTTDGGDEWAYTGEPSLDKSNNDSDFASLRLEPPTVDTDSKLFDSPFTVTVTYPSTATLRYTTDGTTPTTESVECSSGQLEISSTTTLRMRLFEKGKLPSPVVTRTYIMRDRDYYLPVVALSTADDNLYGDSIGIYCVGVNGINARNSGRNSNINMDWERPVNFEYITADGKMVANQEAEMSVAGGWSRHYAPASFKLKARNLYEGQKQFNHQFFPHKPYNKYKVLLVRNGGNDNDSPSHGRIKDAIIQQTLLTSGIYVDCQDLQPTHVFFNGKYIGMLNLREPSNKFYASANYGYDKDNIDAFEYSNGYFQKGGDRTSFQEWLNLSAQVADDAKYEEYRQKVDVDEFINYLAAITYIGSSDWLNNNNNSKGFRSRDDGKFHMVVFDVDWGFSNSRALAQLLGNYGNDVAGIFRNSLANDQFKRQFVDSYCLMGGSVFTPQRAQAVADSLVTLMAPALAMDGKDPIYSCNELLPRMTSSSERETRIQTLRECMDLGTGMSMKLRANIPEAQFRLNGLNVPLAKFDGTVFAPFTLEVSAPAGYNFKGWRTNGTTNVTLCQQGDEWLYYDQGSLDDTDWKTAASVHGWSHGPQPIGYGKGDIATQTRQNLSTYYLRKTISLDEEPSPDDVFTMNYAADDGWVIYVNGIEAARYLMPEGPSTYATLATTYAPNNPDRGTINLPASLFHQGKNIIAVDLHNNKLSSTDIYWNVGIEQKKVGGEITHADRIYEIADDLDRDITAVFEPIDDSYLVHAGATPVVINEVSAANTIFANDYNKRNDWIELYNTTAEPIDVAGMFLSDDPSQPRKYQITAPHTAPEGATIIPPHGYLVVWADKLEPLLQLHAPFKLGNNDDECVVLTAADGSWKDQLTYTAHAGEESVGRYPDGGKRVFLMTRPTIDATNQLTTYSQWLYGEDTDFDPTTGITLDEGLKMKDDHPTSVSTEYFTIDGIRIAKPQPGINIVRITHSNGTVETRKVMMK